MNLSQLRFAAAVASDLSFSRAADRCRVTQPTLSGAIGLLEDEIGGRLFMRTTRKVELSALGERLLPLIEGVLSAQTELEAGIRAFYDPSHKVVRIGMSPLADVRLLTQLLEPYHAEHAGTEAFFKECFLDDLDSRLQDAQLDVIVRPCVAGSRGPRLAVRTPVYEEDLFYLPKRASTAPASDGGAVALADVVGETFVLGPDGCGLASTTRRLFDEAGAELKEYSGQALSFQVMQEWADIGIGATILPGSKIAPAFKRHARRLWIAPKKPARMRFEALWMRRTAYPRHVADLHRHFKKRVPILAGGAAPR